MKWLKLGRIYSPNQDYWWSQLYGMMPTPYLLEKQNLIRIYYGTTDKDRFGRTSYIEVSADNPLHLTYQHNDFLIDLGTPGLFDDCGVIPSSVINENGKIFLYYVGFQRCVRVPYMLYSGLALSDQNSINFERYSNAPIIDRSKDNFISNAAPCVIKHEGLFKMWFWLGKKWININDKLYIKAEIHYADSLDGYNWKINSTPCIKLDPKTEFSVGRPWVINDGIYKMWYSIRYIDKLYRLGYAESEDGLNWIRKDEEIGIDVSEEGWDSEMICYPAIIRVKGKLYMFYNGNNNGETGFGVAELVEH